MTYELAKELKDAGFPQNHSEFYYGQGYGFNDKSVYELHYRSEQKPIRPWVTYLAAPTLSELIEACPKKREGDGKHKHDAYLALEMSPSGRWTAGYNRYQNHEGYYFDEDEEAGETPEEAVARLWLALNKHDA
jgi:ABC-type glycerol-3-phosphate transport system substrate-binding protein